MTGLLLTEPAHLTLLHMAQFFVIHPDNPQPRLIREAVKIIRDGGVVIYPTDS